MLRAEQADFLFELHGNSSSNFGRLPLDPPLKPEAEKKLLALVNLL